MAGEFVESFTFAGLGAVFGNGEMSFKDILKDVAIGLAIVAGAGAIGGLIHAISRWGDDIVASAAKLDNLGVSLGRRTDSVSDMRRADVGGYNSFTGDTNVLMADGSLVPIAEVKVGDVVWAADPEMGRAGPRTVTAVIVGQGDKVLVEIEVDGEATIVATDEHPFWVDSEKTWVDAVDLEVGARLGTDDGSIAVVTGVRVWRAEETVCILTVDDLHTFFVRARDDHVLTHNVDRCPIYRYDAQGRPTHATQYVDQTVVGTGASASGSGFGSGYDRGHIIARVLGGSGGQRNLVGVGSTVNRGAMSASERQVADSVRATGESFNYQVFLTYDGVSTIPSQIRITAEGSAGTILQRILRNVPG